MRKGGDEGAPRFDSRQVQALLPVAGVVCLVLAAWFAWATWQHWRGEHRHAQLVQARDLVVQTIQTVLRTESTRLHNQLASAPVQAALAKGDLQAAAASMRSPEWKTVREVTILPLGMEQAYASLPGIGYGALAAAEAALVADGPANMVGKGTMGTRTADKGQDSAALFIAIPVERLAADAGSDPTPASGPIGVAVARFAEERLTDALHAAVLDDSSYLALRQGVATLHERGDQALENGAEALATKVPGSGLRVAAGTVGSAAGPFGLDTLPALAGVVIWLGLAGLFWWMWRKRARAEGRGGPVGMTLAQALEQDPPPPPARRAIQVPDAGPGPVVVDVHAPMLDAGSDAASAMVDPGIFRAYDIRGVVGQTLDAQVAASIGQAIGTLMFEQGLDEVVVGRDGRLSGPDLVAGLVEGLRKAGRNVVDIGLAPTPVVYFGSYFLRTGCCVAVTGSHNPPDYNGFKIVVGGQTLSGDAITGLHTRIVQGDLHQALQPGSMSERNIDQDYIDRIAEDVQMQRPLKVVVDAGNGVAGELGPRVLQAIGAEVVPLYCDVDGTFPNHHPDPSEPHNLKDLIQMVQRLDADLGVAFDGDGDRLGVVTGDGQTIYPDRLLMLFAADVLERNPGAQIIYDVKCTGHLRGYVLQHGGSPMMWKTGHSLIKAKMRETGAELAGEMSGHFFFSERWFGFDDGIYSAARLLEILAAQELAPGQVLNALPNGVSTPEIKIDAPGGNPHAFVEGFVAQARFEGGDITTIDGLRVDWNDGWGLIRASNTTPVLVLRFDADNTAALNRIQDVFGQQLLAFQPDFPIRFPGA